MEDPHDDEEAVSGLSKARPVYNPMYNLTSLE